MLSKEMRAEEFFGLFFFVSRCLLSDKETKKKPEFRKTLFVSDQEMQSLTTELRCSFEGASGGFCKRKRSQLMPIIG